MTALVFDKFKGEVPILHERELPAGYAQTCVNCNIESGALEAIKGLLVSGIIAESPLKRMFYLKDRWIAWNLDVDTVKSPVEDSDYRFFYTGDSYPKTVNDTLYDAGTPRRLGVKRPDYVGLAPLTISPGGTGETPLYRTVTYFYTYVTDLGEESRPSVATPAVLLQTGEYVILSNVVLNTYAATGNKIAYVRFYRVTTGDNSNSTWDLVKVRPGAVDTDPVYDVPAASITGTSYQIFDVNSSEDDVHIRTGATCPSEGWIEPPDNLTGLTEYQHGVIAGYYENTVYICEPFYYHAFPTGYQYRCGDTVTGLGVHNQNLIVLTEGEPVALVGSDPAYLTKMVLHYNAPCVSKRSVTPTPHGLFWASKYGIMWSDGISVVNSTESILSKEDWDAWSPSDMIGVYREGKLYAFFNGSDEGFVFDFNGTKDIRRFDIVYNVYDLHNRTDGELYLLAGASYYAYLWEGHANYLPYTHKSKKESLPSKTNFKWLKFVGDFVGDDSIIVKVYGDGVLTDTVIVDETGVYPLSAGFKARDWEIEIIESGSQSSKVTTNFVALGTSTKSFLNMSGA